MQRSRFLASMLAAGLAPWAHGRPAPLRFVYPNVNGLGEAGFGWRALQLALRKWGQPYELQLLREPTNNPRSLRALEQGRVSVMDLGTNAELQQRFQPVFLPIDRGLSGWRLLLVRAADSARFAAVHSLADLASLNAGQGTSWPDAALLRAAGLRVDLADRLEGLFKLLRAGRFDYVPLGINEIHGFLRTYRALAPDAIVEPRLALFYPFARLFYVRRGDDERHAAITTGLSRAFEDGSFAALFSAHGATQTALSQARLAERLVLQIDNPVLTEAMRAVPARYFIRP